CRKTAKWLTARGFGDPAHMLIDDLGPGAPSRPVGMARGGHVPQRELRPVVITHMAAEDIDLPAASRERRTDQPPDLIGFGSGQERQVLIGCRGNRRLLLPPQHRSAITRALHPTRQQYDLLAVGTDPIALARLADQSV